MLGRLDQDVQAFGTVTRDACEIDVLHRSQGQQWKEQPWDESILIPFLLRYPAALGRAPRTVPMRLCTPDILPTLLGLAGVAPPPAIRGRDLSPVLQHVGLYGYSRSALDRIANLKMSHYEEIEGLEQLRFLENGLSVYAVDVRPSALPSAGIDTPEDDQ